MISIIIPTRNEENIIGITLAALKTKLSLSHEIIVTDGASTDKTVELAKMYADCSIVNPDELFSIALDDFKKDDKLVALTGWLRVLPDQETFADKIIFNAQNVWMMFLNDVLHYGVSPGGEFQMMRAETFRKVGGFNANLVAAEDIELFGRLGKEGRIRLDHKLKVFHTGRRGHKIGWPKLLSLWFLNTVWMMLFKRAYVKEWKVIR